jgi:chorismate synthase
MASNSFGTLFRFTTWGESHGPAIGVVLDGCPAGLALDEATIDCELARRAPGSSVHTTRRSEPDVCRIMSGVFQGKTTGAPVSLLIANTDADSSKYEAVSHLLRPGHANATYLHKYGTFDYRGGGRASARETAGRVAAGAVARLLLAEAGITVSAWLSAAGDYAAPIFSTAMPEAMEHAAHYARTSSIFAPDAEAEVELARRVAEARADGDSIGGVVTFYATGIPAGLGDPVYEKLDARLASAMLGIPACKGFEIGAGFAAASMRGSVCNDVFMPCERALTTATNHAGGTLGGISSGMPLYGRAAFKPTPSIRKPQATVDVDANPAELVLPEGSRHDPCVAVRAVPVVEAMCLVVLADAWLMNRSTRIEPC